MFCPECMVQYAPGLSRCHHCDVELVDGPPGDDSGTAEVPDGSAYSDYVGVATVNGAIEEAQICSFLQGNGIPTKVRGEALRKTHGITVDGIGAAEIEVPAQFAQAARELIAMADRGELELADDSDKDAI